MDSRQTRKKSYPLNNSAQPSRAPNDNQPSQEKGNSLFSPTITSEESPNLKLQALKNKKKNEQGSLEGLRKEPSEFSLETLKQSGNMGGAYIDNKTGPIQRERKSPASVYSEDDEMKKQIEMLFDIAQASASKGDYQHAINIYNKIVKLNEKSTSAWIAIGHCYAMLGDNFKALSSYQQALSIAPDSQKDDQLWYGIGLLYQKIKDYPNAETSFKNALKLNPSPPIKGEILYNLGMITKAKGDPKEGAKILMNSVLLGSFSIDKMVEILCCVGQAQEEINEVGEAMKTYKHALTLDENNLKALQCAGWLSFQLDRNNEALEYLTKASFINEEDNNILYMKARCYLKAKQHSKAYDYLHRCISREPSNSMYWCSLGILFAEMNQLKSAHECFSNALKFNPTNAENYFNMGCLYELFFQLQDALAMHEKAIELQPDFQLAFTRKLGIYAQLENEGNSHLEVQFKHQKFVLNLVRDTSKDKPTFFPPQFGQGSGSNESKNNYAALLASPGNNENEPTNLHNRENISLINLNNSNKGQSQAQRQQKFQGKQKEQQVLGSISNISNLLSQIQGNPRNVGLSPLDNQIPTNTGALNGHKNLQNDFGSIFSSNQFSSGLGLGSNISFKQQESNVLNLNPSKGKQQRSIPSLKDSKSFQGSTQEQLGNLNDKSFREDMGLLDLQLNYQKPNESSKSSKGVQPIVLKHDPQVLQGKDDLSKVETVNGGNKPQSKGGFKLTHKAPKTDDEFVPQKKVKTDMITQSGNSAIGAGN